MSTATMPPTAPFLSDRPIDTREADRLDLAPFVDRLVRPILLTPDDGGFVVGLYGPWGSGKSSALALLESGLEAVNEAEGPKADDMPYTLVVRFSPWLYSGTETLLPAFFDTLAGAIGRMTKAPKAKRQKLESVIRAIGDVAVPAVTLAATVFGGVFAGNLAKSIAETVKGAATGAAEAMKATSQNFDENLFRHQRDSAAKLLREMKAGLRPIRVVMTIDDLDRATGVDEVLAMLKLVKLIADLPNIVYVIAMDRTHVEDLLSTRVSPRFGLEYLDKIVQVGFSVPAAEPARLSRWLVDEATAIASSAGMDTASLAVDWDILGDWLPSNRFERAVRAALRTPRDVVRILSMYRFAALGDAGTPPLHAVDLLLLTTLQIVAPRVYDGIRVNRRFLLHQDGRYGADYDGRERANDLAAREARLTRLLRGEVHATGGGGDVTPDPTGAGRDASGNVSVATHEAIRALVLQLFPYVITPRDEGRDRREARRLAQVDADAYRVTAPGRFATYFRFAPPPSTAPVRMVREAFALICGTDGSSDIALRDQTDPKAGHTTGTPPWVVMFDAVCSGLPTDTRVSLIDQLGDRMATLTRDEGRALADRLPVLARYSATEIAAPTMRWAAHVVDVLTSYRAGSRGQRKTEALLAQDAATVPSFLVLMVEAYAAGNLARGMAYADDITNEAGYPSTCPTAESQREVAELGVRLGGSLLDQTHDLFAMFGTREAGRVIWSYVRLLRRAGIISYGTRYGPLEHYLKALVRHVPARLGDLLASCAHLGENDAPFFDLDRRADHRDTIAQLVDIDWLDAEVRRVTDASGGAAVVINVHHEDLVRTYRALIDSPPSVQDAAGSAGATDERDDIEPA